MCLLLFTSASFDIKSQQESRFGFVPLTNKVHFGTQLGKYSHYIHTRKPKLNFSLVAVKCCIVYARSLKNVFKKVVALRISNALRIWQLWPHSRLHSSREESVKKELCWAELNRQGKLYSGLLQSGVEIKLSSAETKGG